MSGSVGFRTTRSVIEKGPEKLSPLSVKDVPFGTEMGFPYLTEVSGRLYQYHRPVVM